MIVELNKNEVSNIYGGASLEVAKKFFSEHKVELFIGGGLVLVLGVLVLDLCLCFSAYCSSITPSYRVLIDTIE